MSDINAYGLESGKTLYARLFRRDDDYPFNVSTGLAEAFDAAHVADYAVALTEGGTGSGNYSGDLPANLPNGSWVVVVYQQMGGTPDASDPDLTVPQEFETPLTDDDAIGDNLTSLATVKQLHKITTSANDAILSALIGVVSTAIRQKCDLRFNVQTYQEYSDHPGGDALLLRETPVAEITAITLNPYDGPETHAGSDFIMDKRAGIVRFKNGGHFPKGFQSVLAVYSAGYETIPSDVQGICADIVYKLFSKAGRDLSRTSWQLGDGQESWSVSLLQEAKQWIGPAEMAVLGRYVREPALVVA